MQRVARLFVMSFVLLLLSAPQSFAVSFGAFVDGATGSGEAEWESDWYSWDIDSNAAAIGFVLDTAPTNEKVFNYRLNLGYARHELEDEVGDTMKSNGIYAENIFGFAFVRQQDFRWWGGPLVRVGYYSGDSDTVSVGPGLYSKTDIDYAEFGIGAVTGLNFKVGNAILSPSVGFRINGYAGEGTIREWDSFGGSSYDEDYEAYTGDVFANFAIMF